MQDEDLSSPEEAVSADVTGPSDVETGRVSTRPTGETMLPRSRVQKKGLCRGRKSRPENKGEAVRAGAGRRGAGRTAYGQGQGWGEGEEEWREEGPNRPQQR